VSVTPAVFVYGSPFGWYPLEPCASIAVGVGSSRSASIDSDAPWPFPFPWRSYILAVQASHSSGVFPAPMFTAGVGRRCTAEDRRRSPEPPR